MSVTPQQKHVIDCVLSIFETGRIPSSKSYGTCTILKDGAGISYGKHQCTDKANSLDLVCRKYIELDGQLADSLSHYMVYLQTNESSKVNPAGPYPAWLESLMNLLRSAGSDPMMQRAQDEIFDEFYWVPALKHVENTGIKTALGHLVCYDSTIHSGAGGVTIIRRLFPQKSPLNGGDEKEWIYAYINARKNWLLSSSNQLVRNSASRMDSLKAIADSNNWELNTPLTVKGIKIQ